MLNSGMLNTGYLLYVFAPLLQLDVVLAWSRVHDGDHF